MKRFMLLVMALLFIAGCSREKVSLPEEMPADFAFHVRYGIGDPPKNEINTYNGTVTKDLIADGSVTADISFTQEELLAIYKQMQDLDIMGSKKLGPASKSGTKIPFQQDIWKVTIDGTTKSFEWSDQYVTLTADARQLWELRNWINEIVEGKEAYQALPDVAGGYE